MSPKASQRLSKNVNTPKASQRLSKAVDTPTTPKNYQNPEDSEDIEDTPVPLNRTKRVKTSSTTTYLILGPLFFKAGKYNPINIPDDYEPVTNKTEEPELIRRAPDPDYLNWARLDAMSEAEQLAIRMGCNPDNHREIYSRRNYIYTRAFTLGFDLRVPWKTITSEKKRSLIKHVYKRAQAKYGFDKELVEALMKSLCKNNVKNDNARKKPTRRQQTKATFLKADANAINSEANNNQANEDEDDFDDLETPNPLSTPLGQPVKKKSNPGANQLGNPPTIKQPKLPQGTQGIQLPPYCSITSCP